MNAWLVIAAVTFAVVAVLEGRRIQAARRDADVLMGRAPHPDDPHPHIRTTPRPYDHTKEDRP